jgi:hypothetical protein
MQCATLSRESPVKPPARQDGVRRVTRSVDWEVGRLRGPQMFLCE